MKISTFKNVKAVQGSGTVDIYEFYQKVKNGEWREEANIIRAIPDKKERNKKKAELLELVTISGVFSGRYDKNMVKHSGFLAIDIDDIEEKDRKVVRLRLAEDRYCNAIFDSVSGAHSGFCMIVKIEPNRHRDAFESFSEYLLLEYGVVVDSSGVNESRARFVSYDPYIDINEDSDVFKKYLPKKKKVSNKSLPSPIFVESEFDEMINQMVQAGVDCVDDYRDWITVGFSLASHFGEAGRSYFHQLSSISSKYSPDITDKKYNNLLKSKASGNKATIATIYYHAKNAGIQIRSDKTDRLIKTINSQKKAGVRNKKDISDSLKLSGYTDEDFKGIIEQVLKTNIPESESDIVSDVTAYIDKLKMKRNVITRNIELKGKAIDDIVLNSIYLDVKQKYTKASKDLVHSIIFSDRVKDYNPVIEFFNKKDNSKDYSKCENLNLLLDSVITDTENHRKWITKWLVSLVATAKNKHSPLMLIFAGEKQGTGKTYWFRYLLPNELQYLYAESKMDSGKDDEILMTKKWIIMDDEMGGKSKREEKRLKEITSKQWINVREPYGRVTVDLRRFCMFCGTTNDLQLLNDPTGNRRMLPINILAIDHDKYNACDKDELFHELNHLFEKGYDYTISKEEIDQLNENTADFKASSPEEELIMTYLDKGEDNDFGKWQPITTIIDYLLAHSTRRNHLNNYRIGSILTKMGYKKKRKKVNGIVMNVYLIKYTNASPDWIDRVNNTPEAPF